MTPLRLQGHRRALGLRPGRFSVMEVFMYILKMIFVGLLVAFCSFMGGIIVYINEDEKYGKERRD